MIQCGPAALNSPWVIKQPEAGCKLSRCCLTWPLQSYRAHAFEKQGGRVADGAVPPRIAEALDALQGKYGAAAALAQQPAAGSPGSGRCSSISAASLSPSLRRAPAARVEHGCQGPGSRACKPGCRSRCNRKGAAAAQLKAGVRLSACGPPPKLSIKPGVHATRIFLRVQGAPAEVRC